MPRMRVFWPHGLVLCLKRCLLNARKPGAIRPTDDRIRHHQGRRNPRSRNRSRIGVSRRLARTQVAFRYQNALTGAIAWQRFVHAGLRRTLERPGEAGVTATMQNGRVAGRPRRDRPAIAGGRARRLPPPRVQYTQDRRLQGHIDLAALNARPCGRAFPRRITLRVRRRSRLPRRRSRSRCHRP